MLFGEVDGPEGSVTVVGLPGWRRTRSDLTTCLHGLPSVAYDLPGFGASPPPPEPMGAAGYARVVLDAVSEVAPGPVVILGHSFGGRVAVCAAAQQPERVRALVLTGVPLLRPDSPRRRPALRFRVARALNRRKLLSDARLETLRHRYGSDDYRAASGVVRDVLVKVVNESYEEELGKVRCPVELVWGDRDTAAPVAVAVQASGLLADPHLTVLSGVGHDVPKEAPAELRAAVDRRLSAAPA